MAVEIASKVMAYRTLQFLSGRVLLSCVVVAAFLGLATARPHYPTDTAIGTIDGSGSEHIAIGASQHGRDGYVVGDQAHSSSAHPTPSPLTLSAASDGVHDQHHRHQDSLSRAGVTWNGSRVDNSSYGLDNIATRRNDTRIAVAVVDSNDRSLSANTRDKTMRVAFKDPLLKRLNQTPGRRCEHFHGPAPRHSADVHSSYDPCPYHYVCKHNENLIPGSWWEAELTASPTSPTRNYCKVRPGDDLATGRCQPIRYSTLRLQRREVVKRTILSHRRYWAIYANVVIGFRCSSHETSE